jgi:glutaredoxin
MSKDERKRKVGVRIVTLSDCDYCNWLKNDLDICGIIYINIDAHKFPDFADSIEKKFQTHFYPIVFLDLGSNIITLISETNLDTSDTLHIFETIPHLVGIIKSYINEI